MPETPTSEPTFEQQVESALNPTPPASTPAVPETPATPETPAVPAAETPETPTVEDPLAELKKIEDSPAPDTKTPSLTSEQSQILAAVPTPQVLAEMTQSVQLLGQLDQAVSQRDFATVEKLFEPTALGDFHEYLYQKFITEWVDRWISEKEGTRPTVLVNKDQDRRIAQLESELAQQRETKTQQRQQEANEKVGRDYNAHIKGLFDLIKYSEADRPLVKKLIDAEVASSPTILSAVRSGNMKAINSTFKSVVEAYTGRDRDRTAGQQKILADQDKHKPLVGGGQQPVTTTVTDQMIDGSKGDQRRELLDKKMVDEVSALFGGRRK